MSKRTVSGITLTLLLIGMLTLAFNVQPVEASGTIYIRADGSVEPDTAPISSVDNVTYTFTDNIYDKIVVERDNIVVDGVGYTVQGTGSGNGIYLSGRNNVTIKNMEIKAFYDGIRLYESSNNTISGNNITANNDDGICLFESSNNTISGNKITNNDNGIYLYWSSNNTISGNNITQNNWSGICLYFSSNNTISGNKITNNDDGIYLFESSNNTISGNNITQSNDDGIYLIESSNNTISGNIITQSNWSGIDVYFSSNNTISGNNITQNNWCGIHLLDSSNNTISGNNITANNVYGIYLFGCSNTLRNNDASNHKYNFGVKALSLSHSIHDIDNSNTVDGKPIYYWINRRDVTVPVDAGYVALVNCTNITVRKLNLTNNGQGVLLIFTTNSTITKNNITNNEYGIQLSSSSNNIISGNNITANNRDGIRLDYWSSNNTIYHNNFVDNTEQVYSGNPTNVWDDGYPSGGNYWSDYTGVDANGDGIGDTPYVIDVDNQDRYPLMNPWGSGTPVASFAWSPYTPEVDELVTFDALASMPIGGEIVSFQWDFGDGSHATGEIVTHAYGSAGTFTVTLNVTDSEGLWDIEQKQIEVKAPPPPLTVSISPTSASILVGESVTFTSTVSGGYTPYSYQWYLNGNPVSGATADTWTFTPTENGIYYVYLKVTDDKGNTVQSDTARITVASVPVGGYSIPIQVHTKTEPIIPYVALITMLTAIFIKVKRKTKRKR